MKRGKTPSKKHLPGKDSRTRQKFQETAPGKDSRIPAAARNPERRQEESMKRGKTPSKKQLPLLFLRESAGGSVRFGPLPLPCGGIMRITLAAARHLCHVALQTEERYPGSPF